MDMVKVFLKSAAAWSTTPTQKYTGWKKWTVGTGRVMRDAVGGLEKGLKVNKIPGATTVGKVRQAMTAHPVRTGAVGLAGAALLAGNLVKRLFGGDKR